MKVITLASQKGGAGKTTLAIHLAVLAIEQGLDVALVDLDPQRSASEWWHARNSEIPTLVEGVAHQLPDVLQAARNDGYDIVVVDTAPHTASDVQVSAGLSDLIVVPCRPAILDLRAIGATVEIVKAEKSRGAVVLNSCPVGRGGEEQSITREAREGLKAYGLPIAPVSITQRVAFSHALIDGRAVTEFEPDGKASEELRTLWTWLQGEMGR